MQRCQGAPRTCASAALRPGWASEIAELHPDQPARHQRAQKLAPEGLGLGLADVEPDDLPATSLMHAVGDHHALAHHPPAGTDLLDLGVDEQIGVATLERAAAEGLDLLVKASRDARHLTARDAQPERLHQLIHTACRDPAHIGLLDHAHERLL